MQILDSYMGKTVFFSVLVALLILVGLDMVFAFVAELDSLSGDYQILQAGYYVVLTLPGRCYEFIPIATLLGCLMGMGNLAGKSELTVMRAAGVSVKRIIFAAVKPAIIFVICALLLAQFVVSKTEQYAQSERTRFLSGSDTFQALHGYWFRDDGSYIHINGIQPDGVLLGVARFHYKGQRLLASDFSERAEYQGDHWVLYGMQETLVTKNHALTNTYKELRWDSNITPRFLSIVSLKPDYLSITGLFEYASQLMSQGLESGEYYFAFWKKILQPFATLVMVIIAMSFIFGPLRSVTLGQRVMAGVVVGLLFNYSQDLLGHVSLVYKVAPGIAAALPILICLLVAIYLLRRA